MLSNLTLVKFKLNKRESLDIISNLTLVKFKLNKCKSLEIIKKVDQVEREKIRTHIPWDRFSMSGSFFKKYFSMSSVFIIFMTQPRFQGFLLHFPKKSPGNKVASWPIFLSLDIHSIATWVSKSSQRGGCDG